jgi:hypothetical protein
MPSVYVTDLPISYLVLHLPRLLRSPAEQQYAAGQSVQPVNRPEILQVVLLGQNEDHGVVPVTAAWMHLRITNDRISLCYSRPVRLKLSALGSCRQERLSKP